MDIFKRKFMLMASKILAAGSICYYLPHLAVSNTLSQDQAYQTFKLISQLLTDYYDLDEALAKLFFKKLSSQQNNIAFFALLKEFHELKKNALPEKNTVTLIETTNNHLSDKTLLHNYLSLNLRQQTLIGKELKKTLELWYFGSLENKTPSITAYQKGLVWRTFNAAPAGVYSGTSWDAPPLLTA